MKAHASFSPSASDRWLNCPASHLRSAALPPAPSSAYADRGTLLHEYAAIGLLGTLREMDRKAREAGVTLADDEREAIVTYVNFCKKLRKRSVAWGVEVGVEYSEELFGTVDFYAVADGMLHVVDFKGGRGVLVDVLDNPQLLTYAAMLMEAHSVAKFATRVVTHIVQPLYPNDAPIRSAFYSPERIAGWKERVFAAMTLAKSADAPFNPGEHCRWCPVKPQCPALLGMATSLPAPLEQADMSVEKISEWLTKADTIESWIAALRAHAHELVQGGTAIPGWKLVDKRAIRKWTSEDDVLAAAKIEGLDVQELKLLSPPQVEKRYKTIPLMLQPFIDQTPSGQNLVRDPATAVVTDSAKPALDAALRHLQYRV
jgi:hypothetical protein